jgi:enoyl-CoA hydratase
MTFENIIAAKDGIIGIITLNRPKALNALCLALARDVAAALDDFEADDAIRAIIITGSEKAFAAGADIKEMAPKNFADTFREDLGGGVWDRTARCRKPVIAAVSGYALGGGFELALMCDFIIAADTAKFGLPEITLGTLSGIGGTQRLTKLIGRAKAMEMCLTGRTMDAREAEQSGLVARVVPAAELMAEAVKTAEKIASYSRLAAMMVKEAVHRADETPLQEGLRFERRLFQASFSTHDRKEGMDAFIEKRAPSFQDE